MRTKYILPLLIAPTLLCGCGNAFKSDTEKVGDALFTLKEAIYEKKSLVISMQRKFFKIENGVVAEEPYTDETDEMYLKNANIFYGYSGRYKRTIAYGKIGGNVEETYTLNEENKYVLEENNLYKYYPQDSSSGILTPYKSNVVMIDNYRFEYARTNFANFTLEDGKFTFDYPSIGDSLKGTYEDGKITSLEITRSYPSSGYCYVAIYKDISYNVGEVPAKFNYEFVS